MERPRYREAAPGGSGPGGGSSAAWNGSCGRAPGATTGSGTGTAGGEDDESGERDNAVPGPGSVPVSRTVPKPGGVPEGVPSTESVPKPRSVPSPEGVPNSGSVPGPGSVPIAAGVPNTGTVLGPGSVPNTRSVLNPEDIPKSVPNPEGVPNTKSVPSPGSVPSPSSVPNTGTVLGPEGVPNPTNVPSPGSVPSPGGRCSCRCPPASPPSPSRDLPCGLGCRHRRPPERPGDPRPHGHQHGDPSATTARGQRHQHGDPSATTARGHGHQHEEPGATTARGHGHQHGDPGATAARGHGHQHGEPGATAARGQRGSLWAARAGVALCLRLLGALLALLFLLLLLLRSLLCAASAGLRRSRELLAERFRPRAGRHRGGDSDEEVTRLVTMAEVAEEELDPFRVLGVEPTATDAELRRAYRRLAVLVHPDKSRDPRAEAAFKVLRAGWERVSSPERRREYQAKQLAQGELARALGAFLGRLQEELRDARDAMGCTRCGGRHRRFQLDRDPRGGRWCGPCGGWHAADEGDLWAESSLMGLKVTYLARMDGHIYDVTEWAGCQRVAISPDSHRVPYHLSFGARTATPAGRQRAPPKGSPPTPADLEDFLARVFQGNPGPEPGGAFPAPPGAAGPPQGHPQPQGGPPRGDTKHKRRKKGRRPLPR